MAHALTRTHFIAPKELIERVDRIVGPRRRSDFVAKAISEKLKREELLRVVAHAATLPPVDDIPEWKTPKATSKWVHDLRVESDLLRNV